MASYSGSNYGRRGIQPMAAGDSPSVDAFGRWRVSNPVTLFDASFEYDRQPLLMDWAISSGAAVSYSTLNAMVTVQGGTSSGGSAVFQSREYTHYQPSKSLFTAQSFVCGTATSVATRRVGRFDTNNGVFLEQTGSGVNLVLRRNTTGGVVETRVAQTAWSMDPLNGAGPSGKTLDLTKTNILWVDSQWLGVGRVRAGFDLGGSVVYVHEFDNANGTQTMPYSRSWNLPLRWSSTKNSTGTDAGIKAICGAVVSEGGDENEHAITLAAGNTAAVTCTTVAIRPVCSIRPAPTFQGLTNRVKVEIDSVEVFASGNPAQWYLYYTSTTLTPSSWANVSTANSAVQVNRHATTGTVAGGFAVLQGFIAAAGTPVSARGAVSHGLNSKLPLTLSISATAPRTFTLAAVGVGGSASVRAAFNWREIR